jgi:hypothetical protein
MYLGINSHDSMDVFRLLNDDIWEIIPVEELRVGDVLSGAVVGSIDPECGPLDIDGNNGFDGSPYRNNKTGEVFARIIRRDLLKLGHHEGVVSYMAQQE